MRDLRVRCSWLAVAVATTMGGCGANLQLSAAGVPSLATSSSTKKRDSGAHTTSSSTTTATSTTSRSTTSLSSSAPPSARPSGALVTASGHVRATIEIFRGVSEATGGVYVQSAGAAEVPQNIEQVIERAVPAGVPVDLVFVVDTTGSMDDDIHAVQAEMRTILAQLTRTNPDRRVGVVGYRDRGDEYLTWTFLQLDAHEGSIIHAIDSLKVAGGGDRREHVYAGLNTALMLQPWRQHASQHIVLMGDAPPQENLPGAVTREQVLAQARTAPRNVAIHTIGLRCDDCSDVIAETSTKR